MKDWQLHPAQITALDVLRHTESARFRDLLRATGMMSDVFKFHVRKLVMLGYVIKTEDGSYRLTPSGKEFANSLDERTRTVQKQPKLSVIVLARQPGATGAPRYLVQQRQRNPYYGFWGFVSGPTGWGESFEEAAQRELVKQTGLRADCTVRTFLRQRDYKAESRTLLEDKLFCILEAQNLQGELVHSWPHGTNVWMTVTELEQQAEVFAFSRDMIEWARAGISYITRDYTAGSY
jgi:ADP-ribose pyrophosphatase YjhB (NUDIX family)/predicted transcriptional regulator